MASTLHARFVPPDFYLWGHFKTLVYAAPVDNEESLHHRTVDACQGIRNYPGIFELILRSMMRRAEACMESHDFILNTYCNCTLSAITHKLNVSGHMLIWTFFLSWYVELVPKVCPQFSATSCTCM
jgi:hypothetical protein